MNLEQNILILKEHICDEMPVCEDEEMKADFDALYRVMNGMTLQEMDTAIYPVYAICRNLVKAGVIHGGQCGIQFERELVEYIEHGSVVSASFATVHSIIIIPERNNDYAIFKLLSDFSCSIIFMKDTRYDTKMAELFRIRKEIAVMYGMMHFEKAS